LPREERYKDENVILVGVLPGPTEPNGHQLNHYLEPLVEELQTLWKTGFPFTCMDTSSQEVHCRCYGAILSISCDIPASQKVSGFLSHMAVAGCSRCKKHFKKSLSLSPAIV
jgi:hypothetical protein